MQFADYLVPAAYLLLLCTITLHFRKVRPENTEYFLAGRSIGAVPVGLSVMVTTFSAVNYLALPGEVLGYGLYVLASLPAFFLAAWPVTRYWIPFFRQQKTVSVYAFLEQRFDLKVRILCSALFLVWRIFWMAVALYASSRITSLLTGMDFYTVLLLSGAAAAAYSAIGGMRAVIWTDAMQFCVLFGSILTGVFLVWRGEDFGAVLEAAGTLKPFCPADLSYYSFDPTIRITLWSGLLGSFVMFLTRFGADQMVMQRYLSAKSTEAAQRGLWINGIASVTSLSLLAVFGLAAAVFMRRTGIPAGTPPVKVIALLLKSFPPGTAGVIGAGLLAATMSSIDSGLNSCSAAIVLDFQERFRLRRIRPGVLTVLLALPVLAGGAFLLPELNKSQTMFVILNKTVNTIGTPLLAVMIFALFTRKIRASEVFAGTLTGISATVVVSCTVTNLALHYYSVLSLLMTAGAVFFFHGIEHFKIKGTHK